MRRLLTWLSLAFFLALAACQPNGFFGPSSVTATPPGELVRQATQLTFAQLNADPAAYQDEFIRISGGYLDLPAPDCHPYRGPVLVWSLADLAPSLFEQLRVDMQGFEDVIHLVPEGTPVAVEGFWRLYQGPLGCGKNAPRAAVWYLQVLRIVSPNPFPGELEGSPRLTPTPGDEQEIESTPLATPTLSATPDPRLTPSVTPTVTATPGATPSPDLLLTPSPTATMALTPALTGTSTTGTLDITGTPPVDEPATATPEGGYPGPATPFPTATQEGYP